MAMTMIGKAFLGMCLASTALAGAEAVAAPQTHHRTDQQAAREARIQGRLLPLREIERRIGPNIICAFPGPRTRPVSTVAS